jgi:hypothetical protein
MIELKYSIERFFIGIDGKERRKKNSYLPVIGTSAVLCYIKN